MKPWFWLCICAPSLHYVSTAVQRSSCPGLASCNATLLDDDSVSLLQLSHHSERRSGVLTTVEIEDERAAVAIPFYMNPEDMTPGVRAKVLAALYPSSPSAAVKNKSSHQHQCPKCSSYPSLIRLNEGLLPCGLLDRLTNLRIWSQVAVSLCARLEVPPPCAMLSKSLVGHKPLAHDVPWSHYVEMRVVGDNSSVLASPTTANLTNGTRVVIPEKVEEINLAMSGSSPMERLNILNYAEGAGLRKQAAATLKTKYSNALRSLAVGKAFQWDLHEDWLIFDWMILLPAINYCPLVSMEPAQSIKDTTTTFYEKLGLHEGKYVTLHVRRGDAINACDTRVRNVVNYVACSLTQEGWMNRTDQPLVIFTDETSGVYKTELLNGLKSLLGHNRTVLFGDPVIHEIAKSKDGPFKFATTLLLRQQAEAELFMDRTQCLPCGVCKEHCRGANFDEYVVRAQMSVTPEAAKLCNKFLQAEPPVSSCAALHQNITNATFKTNTSITSVLPSELSSKLQGILKTIGSRWTSMR